MKQIQINFQNNKFLVDLSENNSNNSSNTYVRIEKELKKRYGLIKSKYYITTNNKLINKEWDFSQAYSYQVHIRIKGGFLDLFMKLIRGIIQIAIVIGSIPSFVIWLIQLIMWIILEVLNPKTFFEDLATSVFSVIQFFLLTIMDMFSGVIKYFVNLIAGPMLSSFWGYTPEREKDSYVIIFNGSKTDDFVVVKKSKDLFDAKFKIGEKIMIQSNKDDSHQLATIVNTFIQTGTSKYGTTKVMLDTKLETYYNSGSVLTKPVRYGDGRTVNHCNKKKCIQLIKPNSRLTGSDLKLGLNIDLGKNPKGTPMAVILCTILLPPLGLFMELGLKGWINILLCGLLTFFYYFPGLIYALIIIYC
jgi:uncharacterized membrane protein YqaE (UPF0057 family)